MALSYQQVLALQAITAFLLRQLHPLMVLVQLHQIQVLVAYVQPVAIVPLDQHYLHNVQLEPITTTQAPKPPVTVKIVQQDTIAPVQEILILQLHAKLGIIALVQLPRQLNILPHQVTIRMQGQRIQSHVQQVHTIQVPLKQIVPLVQLVGTVVIFP